VRSVNRHAVHTVREQNIPRGARMVGSPSWNLRGRGDRPIGHDEVPLRVSNSEYWTRCSSHDVFSDAAHEHMSHKPTTMRTHHDQVDVTVFRVLDNLDVRCTHKRGELG
jgi:hypothetical protein